MSTQPSYRKMALSHPLNLFLIASAAGASAATGSFVPLALGLGAELLWLITAPFFSSERRTFDWMHLKKLQKEKNAQRQKLLSSVAEDQRKRYFEVERLGRDIHKLCETNPSFTTEMLEGELHKLDDLLDAFLRLSANVARYEDYAATTDIDELEAEVRRQTTLVEGATDPEEKDLARQNLDLMEGRLDRALDVRKRIRGARGQLNLIENAVRLLRDQIVTMESPEELHHQLEDLVGSVEAIEASSKETQALTKLGQQLASSS